MTEKALKTEHGFEGGRLVVVTLKRIHRRSIAEDRRTGKWWWLASNAPTTWASMFKPVAYLRERAGYPDG
ncbi:MAG: hypothetical protein CV081_04855 [Nitrospira sp. LK265]|nr:hypothetical protein [Nitrospira sp. LK265]